MAWRTVIDMHGAFIDCPIAICGKKTEQKSCFCVENKFLIVKFWRSVMVWIVNLKVLQSDSNFFRVSETLSCTRYNHSFCSSSISNFSAKFPTPTSKKKNPLQRSWCHVLLVVLGMLPRINSDLHPEISREQQHRWVACSPVHLWEMFFHSIATAYHDSHSNYDLRVSAENESQKKTILCRARFRPDRGELTRLLEEIPSAGVR